VCEPLRGLWGLETQTIFGCLSKTLLSPLRATGVGIRGDGGDRFLSLLAARCAVVGASGSCARTGHIQRVESVTALCLPRTALQRHVPCGIVGRGIKFRCGVLSHRAKQAVRLNVCAIGVRTGERASPCRESPTTLRSARGSLSAVSQESR
jgi:hypothetical protein